MAEGKPRRRRLILGALAAWLAWAGAAAAAEIRVMASGGFTAAYRALVPAFEKETGISVTYNADPLDLKKLMGDQDNIAGNLRRYVQGFSPEVRDIFEHFEFDTQIDRLARAGLLYQVVEKFAGIDLHPERVSNHQMGLVFEELIGVVAELSP